MIQRLRQETKELHEQIESKNPAAAILDHSISLEAYRHLLLQNYIAYRAIEKEINRFLPEYTGLKHLQLKKDLERLDISPELTEYLEYFRINSFAEALGAAYVVEGSVMGGMVIARHLKHCSLDGVEQSHFFSGDRDAVNNWNDFKSRLKSFTLTPEEEEQAVQKAKETFLFFEKVFDTRFSVPV